MKRFIQLLTLTSLIVTLCLTSCGTPATPSEVPGSDTPATSTEPATEAATETEPAVESMVGNFDFASISDHLDANYTANGTSMVAAKTAKKTKEQVYSSAYQNSTLLSDDFAAELEFSVSDRYSAAGLLFRASEAKDYEGIQGYALMV